jgi:hypothetical protein
MPVNVVGFNWHGHGGEEQLANMKIIIVEQKRMIAELKIFALFIEILPSGKHAYPVYTQDY